MFLKKLDITGFKSFAQKTVLEFDRGIASIVGPNGSGKSNAADAIRWVLGEQSVKLLRGKKSEDVIFSGSTSKARLGMAEASLTLDNEDRQMPVDYSEVVMTRRIYRSGEGEYLLNKQPVRLHDIQLLLAKSNFAQKSYSVIGQGMIDHVLVATPLERKIFFDEAAGVRQFQIKREQAVNKLEQTKDNLSQAHLLLAEIEPRLRTLTRQVRRLEKRGGVEAELREQQIAYYSKRLAELAQELGRHEATATDQKNKQAEEQKLLTALQAELERLERERSRQSLFEELQRDYAKALEEKNAILKEQVVLEGAEELEAAKSGELNVVWLENRERELARTLEDLDGEIASLASDTKREETELKKREELLRTLVVQLEKLEAKFETTKEQSRRGVAVHVLSSEIATLHEEFLTVKGLLEKEESERGWKELKRELHRFAERFKGLIARFRAATTSVQLPDILRLQEELMRLLRSKEQAAGELHGLTTGLERKKERLMALAESKERLQQELERVKRELERLTPAGKRSAASIRNQRRALETQLRELDGQLQQLRTRIVNFNAEEQSKKEHLFELQKKFRDKQNDLNIATNALNVTRVSIAKLETRRDDLHREIRTELPSDAAETLIVGKGGGEISGESEEKLLAEIMNLKHQIELIGGIDESVTEEFKMTDERHNFLSTQVTDLDRATEDLEEAIAQLDATIKKQFHSSFQAINREFGKYFKVLFNGGNAKLVLVESEIPVGGEEDEEDEESEDEEEIPEMPASPSETKKSKLKTEKVITGVEIMATPPGKRISGITMLSGGERAMGSIALICAILATRPSPFVVLDEVDAALDEANSQRFAAILRELAHRTQFITITHNRATMAISSVLYGVTMNEDGVSKLLSIKMEDAERVIEQHGNR